MAIRSVTVARADVHRTAVGRRAGARTGNGNTVPFLLVTAIAILSLAARPARSPAQETAQPQKVEIPAAATALEGIPTVRIDSTEEGTQRRVLTAGEAAKNRLNVTVVNGTFYWTSRDNRPLQVSSTGEFTYLSSEPGKYIRITRLNDKLSYVEHVDMGSGSVTWWGELKITVGK
jgi:hypothetical protein